MVCSLVCFLVTSDGWKWECHQFSSTSLGSTDADADERWLKGPKEGEEEKEKLKVWSGLCYWALQTSPFPYMKQQFYQGIKDLRSWYISLFYDRELIVITMGKDRDHYGKWSWSFQFFHPWSWSYVKIYLWASPGQ